MPSFTAAGAQAQFAAKAPCSFSDQPMRGTPLPQVSGGARFLRIDGEVMSRSFDLKILVCLRNKMVGGSCGQRLYREVRVRGALSMLSTGVTVLWSRAGATYPWRPGGCVCWQSEMRTGQHFFVYAVAVRSTGLNVAR
jgi:hypothetical protein